MQNAWDGISLVAPDGTVLANFPDNLDRLGHRPEEFVGHNGLDFIHPDDRPALQALLAQLLREPGARAATSYRLRAKDGTWRWMEGTATNLLHEPGVGAVVDNYHDGSERRGLEEALRQRAEELAAANARKDEFLAALAHELRNPLAPVLTCLHLLDQPGLDPGTREKARQTMGRQLRHLVRLVDGVLDVSRLQRGKVALERERLDLTRLVRATAEDYRPLLERAGLALEVACPPTPVWVNGDATRLTQALSNLLDNAAKFSGPGVRVAVTVTREDEPRQAVLTVRDSGAGIGPEVLGRLFTPFAQADRSLDRSKGGLGLGLAVVKGLVELHDGRVEAASAGPGRGAEFTIRLPAEPEPASLRPDPTAPAGVPPSEPPLRVLVVEDNPDAAAVLDLFLEALGHEREVTSSGPEGVAAARRFRPDVVLCDIGLPGLSGYEVARELRRCPETAGARLIAVTGYGADEDRRRSLAAGFEAHLVKPVHPKVLGRLLVRRIRGQ